MNCSENMDKFWPAFFNLQQDIDPKIVKETEAYKYKYAPIEVVWERVKPYLKTHGFVYFESLGDTRLSITGSKYQEFEEKTGKDAFKKSHAAENLVITVRGKLVHVESGEWIESVLDVPLRSNDPQEAGQCITYGRRYNMVTVFNLTPVGEDDDAQPKGQASKAKVTQKSVKPLLTPRPVQPKKTEGDSKVPMTLSLPNNSKKITMKPTNDVDDASVAETYGRANMLKPVKDKLNSPIINEVRDESYTIADDPE